MKQIDRLVKIIYVFLEASEPKWVNPNDIKYGLTHLGSKTSIWHDRYICINDLYIGTEMLLQYTVYYKEINMWVMARQTRLQWQKEERENINLLTTSTSSAFGIFILFYWASFRYYVTKQLLVTQTLCSYRVFFCF